jgi:hypothetical protein
MLTVPGLSKNNDRRKEGNQLGDWKTTLTGFVTAVAGLLAHFNILIPDTWQTVIITVGVFILGLVAKDSKPSTS